MSYTVYRDYKTCTSCGTNLDHGEKCDCGTMKTPLLLSDYGRFIQTLARINGITVAEAYSFIEELTQPKTASHKLHGL